MYHKPPQQQGPLKGQMRNLIKNGVEKIEDSIADSDVPSVGWPRGEEARSSTFFEQPPQAEAALAKQGPWGCNRAYPARPLL